jgi:hypothetical protein
MKPTLQNINNGRTRTNGRNFPVTDFNYQAVSLDGFNGRCARADAPSFRSISRKYFDTEAQQHFLAEASVFAGIMLTAAVPLVNGAHAVLNLVRASGGF